jgi:hypothetical protein
MTYDGAAIRLYVNGELVDTTPPSPLILVEPRPGTRRTRSGAPEHIADSESCFFGLCVIHGWVEDAVSSEERRKPQLGFHWVAIT